MNSILNPLNPQQQQAVRHLDGPALVVAGPGSGKTRVLVHRVAYLIQQEHAQPHEILAITFTNKAAGEMKSRILQLLTPNLQPPTVGTFHATCARWLRRSGSAIGIDSNFTIYDQNDSQQALKQVMEHLKIPKGKIKPSAVKYVISSAKNSLVTAEDYPKYAYGFLQEQAAKIYPVYQRLLAKNNALDFDDLLFKTVQLFVEVPTVLANYQLRFKYVFVDEYQDTNQAQYTISKLLAQRGENIFAVGDMSQAIYSWRGADYRNVLNFKKDYPDAVVYPLEQNYRSTPNIIKAAKEVIKNNRAQAHLNLWTNNQAGEKVVVFTAKDERDEARYIIDHLESAASVPHSAVLYRTNAQSRALEEAFMKAGLAYRLVGGTKFYERKEIKDVLAYLSFVANPNDSVAYNRILTIGKRRAAKFEQLRRQEKVTASHHPLEVVDKVIKTVDYFGYLDKGTPESEARIENVKELRSVATNFNTLLEFLENVALVQDSHFPTASPMDRESEVIVLSTLHSAKGLEFDVVFMVGLEESLLPHSRSLDDPGQLEEERRLCYVGMTRAKEQLHLIHTNNRLYFGSHRCHQLSRFITEIPEQLVCKITSPLITTSAPGANLASLKKDFDSFLEEEAGRGSWEF